MNPEELQRKLEGGIDKYGDKANEAVHSNKKYIGYAAIAVAAVGALLLLGLGF
jgi:hypothetical protein